MIEIIGVVIILVAIVAFLFSIKTKKDLNKSKECLASTLNKLKVKQAECGTTIIEFSSTIEIPDGYELPKFNSKTGYAEYSDGTIAEHLELRKIQ